MIKKLVFTGALLLIATSTFAAEDRIKEGSEQTKTLSGMSIVGNDEAPKSLYIVPWKSSEIGVETSLDMNASKAAAPIDRAVFERQLNFYKASQIN